MKVQAGRHQHKQTIIGKVSGEYGEKADIVVPISNSFCLFIIPVRSHKPWLDSMKMADTKIFTGKWTYIALVMRKTKQSIFLVLRFFFSCEQTWFSCFSLICQGIHRHLLSSIFHLWALNVSTESSSSIKVWSNVKDYDPYSPVELSQTMIRMLSDHSLWSVWGHIMAGKLWSPGFGQEIPRAELLPA